MTTVAAVPQPAPPGGFPLKFIHGEPSVEKPPQDAPSQDFRFRFHSQLRLQLRSAVRSSSLPVAQKLRFETCGANAWIQRSHSTGRYRVVSETCKLRFCPACRLNAARHAKQWIEQVLAIKSHNDWRFVPLTSRHTREPLSTQVAKLKKAFRRLRQRRFWRERNTIGFAVLEVKVSEKDGCWHPHLHVVTRGLYMDKCKLSKEWLLATRTSMVVGIRKVHTPAYAAHYLTKYITKPPPSCVFASTDSFNEWLDAMRYVKVMTTFGNVPAYVDPRAADDYPTDWEPLCSLAQCVERAHAGDPAWRAILNALMEATDEPFDRDLFDLNATPMPAVRDPPIRG